MGPLMVVCVYKSRVEGGHHSFSFIMLIGWVQTPALALCVTLQICRLLLKPWNGTDHW